MRFDWDPDKAARTLRERRLPFDLAAFMFEGPVLERVDTRQDYGERRVVAVGKVRSLVLSCVYTDLAVAGETVRRIISLRVASRKERKAYAEWSNSQEAVQP